jgi:hypothetical protein
MIARCEQEQVSYRVLILIQIIGLDKLSNSYPLKLLREVAVFGLRTLWFK